MKTIILGIALLIITITSCDSPTEIIDNTQPGRRDYVWTVDTLNIPGTTYYRMWGSSPSNLWMISSSNWDKSIAHYDGEKWSLYGEPGIVDPYSIYGFSSSNIYIGTMGHVWNYDGANWNHITELPKDNNNHAVINNIWGDSPNSIYAYGAYPEENGYYNNSVIVHYSSGKWEMYNTDMLYGIVSRLYKNKFDNHIYLQVIGGRNLTDSTSIYEYKNGGYNLLYSDLWIKGKQSDLSYIDGEVYFIMGSRIAVRRNDKFYTLLNVDNPNFYQRIWGRNSKDIFLLMTDGLAHYNGSDMEYLFYFNRPDDRPYTQIYGAALFENISIFLVREPSTGLNMIYTGRINVN